MVDTDSRAMTKVFFKRIGVLELGYIPDDEVSDYLKQLRSFVLPETRCCSGYKFILKTYNVSGAPWMYSRDAQGQYLQITPTSVWKNPMQREQPLCGLFRDEFGDVVPERTCFEKIKNGQCPDSFIMKNIFEKFFQNDKGKK